MIRKAYIDNVLAHQCSIFS